MRFRGLVLLVALSVAGNAFPDEFEQILDAVEVAYGGQGAVARLQSYRVEGKTSSRMRGEVGTVIREYRAPDSLRVEIAYPGRTEIRVVNRDGVWRSGPSGIREVEGPMRDAILYQMLRSDVPGVLLRHRARLEDGGVVEHEDGARRLLVLRWTTSLTMRYWIHIESRRIISVEGVIGVGENHLIFATEFSDFRRIEGVLFPFAEKNYASGRHVADTKLERLVLELTGTIVASPTNMGFDPTKRAQNLMH